MELGPVAMKIEHNKKVTPVARSDIEASKDQARATGRTPDDLPKDETL